MQTKQQSIPYLTLFAVLGLSIVANAQTEPAPEANATATVYTQASAQEESDMRLFDMLEQPTALYSIESPLVDVIQSLSDKHKVRIIFEEEWFKNERPDVDVLISMDASGLKLRDVLDQILPPLGMSFIIRDGAIQITSLEYAQDYQYVRQYKLPPFTDGQEAKVVGGITKTVSPELWTQGGGEYSASASDGLLTINANRRIHTASVMTLEKMRRMHELRTSRQPRLRGDITAPHKDPFATTEPQEP